MTEQKTKTSSTLLFGMLATILLLNVSSVESAPLGPCVPPASGNWVVSSPTTCQDMTISMAGNITVTSTLEIFNTTILFTNPSTTTYSIIGTAGSILNIQNSTITTANTGAYFNILIRDNVDFSIANSHLSMVGAKDPELLSTYLYNEGSFSEYKEYGRFFWLQGDFPRIYDLTLKVLPFYDEDGIVLESTVTEFRNNTIENFTAIWLYADNNLIENNSFIGMKNHGLGFMNDSDGNKVIGNYFGYAARMNRQIAGIKFFPGTHNEEIAYNTIEWVPDGMSVAEMPPNTLSSGFYFHHNTIRKTIHAAGFAASHVLFSNENYSEIYAVGIAVSSYYNVTIQNSTFTNLAFQEEVSDSINRAYYDECNARGLLENNAFWMFVFYSTKAFIKPVGWGNLLVVQDNYFGYAPPYGNGIVFDGAVHHNFRVYNNVFENIGNYVPPGFKTIKDQITGRVPLAGDSGLPGAAISLEGIRKANIEGNTFRNVVHGILTSTPDSLGTYGNYTIRNNKFEGLGEFTYTEYPLWSSFTYNTVEKGIGIGIGTHGWTSWNNPAKNGIEWGCTEEVGGAYLHIIYSGDTIQLIENNTLNNFYYPVVIDFARYSDCEKNVLGPKHAKIYNNSFFNYTTFNFVQGPPSTIEFTDNKDVCQDQTQYGYCSQTQPLFCQDGLLVDNCSACGCPGLDTCAPDGTCVVIPPCGPYDTNLDGNINQAELDATIQDWFRGVLNISDLAETIRSWMEGTCHVN
ncbi:MAG: right-handed parallel beta-helix repeat-containing protein [Candidatus Woesearchaeota archaeon]